MGATRITNKGVNALTPNVREASLYKMADYGSYTTGIDFTVTSVNATPVPALYPTPGTAAIPGRSALSVPYASGITDGTQMQRPTASVIPQLPSPGPYNLNPFIIKFAVASTNMAAASAGPSFFCGLAQINTTILTTGGALLSTIQNLVGISKAAADVGFFLSYNKANAGITRVALPMIALTNATWYDFCLVLNRDPINAGMAIADIYWDVNVQPETGYSNHVTIPIATLFPDTVVTTPSIATAVGASSVTNYLDYFGWQQGN